MLADDGLIKWFLPGLHAGAVSDVLPAARDAGHLAQPDERGPLTHRAVSNLGAGGLALTIGSTLQLSWPTEAALVLPQHLGAGSAEADSKVSGS